MDSDLLLHDYLKRRDSVNPHLLLGTPNGRLLDMGSGDGTDMRALQDLGWGVVGVEPFQHSGEGAWVRGVAEHLPFRTGTFSAVTCILVLPSMRDPLPAVREAYRVLGAAGRAVFVVFSTSILNAKIGVTGQVYGGGPWLPNRHLYSPRRLRTELEEAGFSSIVVMRSDYLPWFYKAIPRKARSRFLAALANVEPRFSKSPAGLLARKLVAIGVKV